MPISGALPAFRTSMSTQRAFRLMVNGGVLHGPPRVLQLSTSQVARRALATAPRALAPAGSAARGHGGAGSAGAGATGWLVAASGAVILGGVTVAMPSSARPEAEPVEVQQPCGIKPVCQRSARRVSSSSMAAPGAANSRRCPCTRTRRRCCWPAAGPCQRGGRCPRTAELTPGTALIFARHARCHVASPPTHTPAHRRRVAIQDPQTVPTLTLAEVQADHGDHVWVTLNGGVYDVTEFLEAHPGGQHRIRMVNGGDLKAFWKV